MASVLRHFAVGIRGKIDGLRPAHLRHIASNSTAEAGQHLIRSLNAFVNRLLNTDLSDHARKLLFSANLTALRMEDGGIRHFAVGNVFCRLASKVGCTAVTPSLVTPSLVTPSLVTPSLVTPSLVTPSLVRQISPTQIGVDVQSACKAASCTTPIGSGPHRVTPE